MMHPAAVPDESLPEVQWAAGGLVWRTEGGVRKLAVIHRPRYDDWTLPKGKPEPGETIAQTALREVREELGCDARFDDFAGVIHYALTERRVKVVLFWHMTLVGAFEFGANDEVDQVLWLTPEAAVNQLSHPVEQHLVGRFQRPVASGAP